MQATRLNDKNSGHDNCPPTTLSTASNNVFINDKGAGRIGDNYKIHSCKDHPPHQGIISSGSSSVFINTKSAARVGDSVNCGGDVVEGSSNVFIGG